MSATPSRPGPLNLARILIVEPDAEAAACLAGEIEGAGGQCLRARDSDGAGRILAERQIDLLYISLAAHIENDLRLCRTLRRQEIGEWIPILVAVTPEQTEAMDRAFEAGVSDCMVKPFHGRELLARMRAQMLFRNTQDKIYQQRQQLRMSLEGQKKLLEDLRAKNQELQEMNRQKDRLLSIASHDLRAPLAGLAGYCDNMRDGLYGDLSPEQHGIMLKIQNRIHQMLALLNDLLDLSHIESGNADLKTDTESVESIVAESTDLIRAQAEEKSIALQLNLAKGLPKVVVDRQKMVQCFTNLLSNAVKYSPPGSMVEVGALMEQAERVKYFVTDQGPGIPSEELGHLFKRFSKLSTQPTGGERQTGLGLSITKDFVEMHGGTIGVDSVEGEGSTFWITFLLEPPPPSQTPRILPPGDGKPQLLGELVVSLGLVTPDKVLAALDIQAKERSQGRAIRKLGEILVDSGFVSRQDLNHALRERA